MSTLKFNLNENGNKIKILNATNGGPWHKRHATDQLRSNFSDYKAARIPYSRNHDSAVCGVYGGPYSHDITCIFPDFDADEYSSESYDFACTDESILVCLDAGTETFFRLGQTIEHQIKKHGTLPPKDFKKWAQVCEHIIRHYNEGWADGYQFNIQYWEIWNEADLDSDDSPNKRTWGGTKAEFFDLFEITAKHLKVCFPDLKIGGPALAWNEEWAEDFLREMQKRNVPLDFFSWHIYCTEPSHMVSKAQRMKKLLNKYGYENAESILNEWNYVRGWEEEYVYSLKAIHGIKGAAFVMSCMCEAQKTDIDMLMYYDTRPSVFNGVFDFYTYEKLKGYYPLYWYGLLYDCEKEIPAENNIENIYSLCGVDSDGNATVILTYYSEDDSLPKKNVSLELGRTGNYEIYKVDSTHNGELTQITDTLSFELELFSIVLIKEK